MNPKSSFSAEDFAKALEQHDYRFQKGQVVRGKVFQLDQDGAYIDIKGKSPAFLPFGEAALQPIKELSEAVSLDEEREFLVVRDANDDGQVTVSIRQMELKLVWDELSELEKDSQSIEVRVTGTNRGGVTVDVKGLRGFIPRSHLIERENLELLVGQVFNATILETDRDRDRVVVSQRLAAQATRTNSLTTGSVVEGRVVSLKPYGAFIDLGGATGLLHIKQISQRRVESIETVFQMGQTLKVAISEIDEWKGRISLSTKVLESYPGEILEKFDEVMANAEQRMSQSQASPEPEKPQLANNSDES
ncbi:MAG: S1 RNA-binding domain-containing protein [Geitlerinemataceae cyanobacterium]